MNARAAARAVLIVALVALGFGSAAMYAEPQTSTLAPAGEDQKLAPPPAAEKAENDDLDRIPMPPAADAEPEVSQNGNQRVYIENAFTGSTGRGNLLVPVSQSTTTWQE